MLHSPRPEIELKSIPSNQSTPFLFKMYFISIYL